MLQKVLNLIINFLQKYNKTEPIIIQPDNFTEEERELVKEVREHKAEAEQLAREKELKEEQIEEPVITVEALITASGKFPERLDSEDLTDEVRENLANLAEILNQFLEEIGIIGVNITSGFRPKIVNKNVGGAKKSLHLQGLAVDIADADGYLKTAIAENAFDKSPNDLLAKYGLWMEHEDFTPTWCHLDLGNRWKRKIRIFRPY